MALQVRVATRYLDIQAALVAGPVLAMKYSGWRTRFHIDGQYLVIYTHPGCVKELRKEMVEVCTFDRFAREESTQH